MVLGRFFSPIYKKGNFVCFNLIVRSGSAEIKTWVV